MKLFKYQLRLIENKKNHVYNNRHNQLIKIINIIKIMPYEDLDMIVKVCFVNHLI